MLSPFNELLHLFFPHVCEGCGSDIIDKDHQICLRCIANLPVSNFLSQPGNAVEKKFYGRMPVRNAGAAYYFTKDSVLEKLIYALKYRSNKDIGFYLGKLVGRYLMETQNYDSVDVLVPLPLNPRREKKRGYNQATVLCEGIASIWQKPVYDKAVIRKVHTETQTKKDRISRWQNMDGVFMVNDTAAMSNKHILLVDDIITTGATLEACGSEIVKVPGASLSIATLAYTV